MKCNQGGMLFEDPCGGTGILSVDIGGRCVAARCLCAKGQLRTSPAIPLVTELPGVFTEWLQDLYPAGIPEILTADDVVTVPGVGRVRKSRRRHIQEAYAEGLRDGRERRG